MPRENIIHRMLTTTRRITLAALTLIVVVFLTGAVQPRVRRSLEIFYIDVEGGAATLIVTPAGESVLIDAGWPGFEGRDAQRIQRAMAQADVSSIDHLITTHYHTDHYGGLPTLAAAVPIRKFYDHGPMEQLVEDPDFPQKYAAYLAAAGKSKPTTLRPGDAIKLRRAAGSPPISLRCLAANGVTISAPRGSAKPNTECQTSSLKGDDPSDNARSIVVWLKLGDFDFFDAGDLTWNIERRLACPVSLVGEVDLYQVTHHGLSTSNNPVLLKSLRPTVAIMNNGPHKGSDPETVQNLRQLTSLKDLFQVHLNVRSKPQGNAPPEFIANLVEQPDEAHMITVSVNSEQRSFIVTNGRTGVSRSYLFK